MNTIEPPVLMSRILTFVFAAALATVVVLAVTLANMFPLEKTQIFILSTQPRANTEITMQTFSPSDANIGEFKENFIKEYVKVRNEVIRSINVMRRKWGTDDGGMVNIWSAPDVYNAFAKTRMFYEVMANVPESELECRVEFADHPVRLLRRGANGDSTYEVNFWYSCANNALQTSPKNYTIVIGTTFYDKINWERRLKNPLGIYVSEYTVEKGGGDPLDFVQ